MTIKDIAEICNVSISTVSRAMNDAPGINSETRKRIMKMVDELNYVPNNSARNLKRTYSHMAAIMVKGFNNPFFQSMLPYFQKGFDDAGFQYIIHFINEEADEAYEAEKLVKEKKLRGIIFLGGRMQDPQVVMRRIQVPCVLCSVAGSYEEYASSPLPYVSIDDTEEAARVVDYLCSRGHRKIAIIAGRRDDTTVALHRLNGYRRALGAHGIGFDEDLVGYMHTDIPEYTEASGYAAAMDLLCRGREFTAFFVISDRMAMGVYKAVYDFGKRVPEDYSVVGFDGIESTRYMTPALTTMAQPAEKMVQSSVDMLMMQIEGEKVTKHELYQTQLCERESVKSLP